VEGKTRNSTPKKKLCKHNFEGRPYINQDNTVPHEEKIRGKKELWKISELSVGGGKEDPLVEERSTERPT